MHRSDGIRSAARAALCGLAILSAIPSPASAQPAPQRVVSVNLCTDQLALMLAAPGQLVSVSRLAHDPDSSTMVEAARQLPANGSGAEEVYLLAPDLVLAGSFTAPATVSLLRDLGIRVEIFAPAESLADIPDRILQMGRALGREDAASAVVDDFQHRLAALSDADATRRPRVAITYVNSYSSGDRTLAGDILRTAGFDNVANEAGLSSVGKLALEDLVMLAPDVIVQGRDYPGEARAENNLDHPALRALKGTVLSGEIVDRDWICGTPVVLNAIAEMRRLRLEVERGR